jgi:hypothetical protein
MRKAGIWVSPACPHSRWRNRRSKDSKRKGEKACYVSFFSFKLAQLVVSFKREYERNHKKGGDDDVARHATTRTVAEHSNIIIQEVPSANKNK